jgi:hypothetical protein
MVAFSALTAQSLEQEGATDGHSQQRQLRKRAKSTPLSQPTPRPNPPTKLLPGSFLNHKGGKGLIFCLTLPRLLFETSSCSHLLRNFPSICVEATWTFIHFVALCSPVCITTTSDTNLFYSAVPCAGNALNYFGCGQGLLDPTAARVPVGPQRSRQPPPGFPQTLAPCLHPRSSLSKRVAHILAACPTQDLPDGH